MTWTKEIYFLTQAKLLKKKECVPGASNFPVLCLSALAHAEVGKPSGLIALPVD